MTETTSFSLSNIINDAKKVLFNPVEFYKNMAKTGGYFEPLIFILVMSVIGGLIATVLNLIGVSSAFSMMGGAGLMALILMPIFVTIGSFIGAFILHIVWKLLGTNESFETSYRCVAYSSAIVPIIVLLSVVPYLDTIVRVVWGAWLMIVASIEIHNVASNKAKIVFGILALIMLFLGLSGQYASRSMSDSMPEWTDDMNKKMQKLENIENMTPEQAGKATRDFLKGFGMEDKMQNNSQ